MIPSRTGSRSPIDSASYSTAQETVQDNPRRSTHYPSTSGDTRLPGLPPRPNPMLISSLDNPAPTSTVSHLASRFRQQDLLGAVIQQHNPQDFDGPPLPSGASVDSRATGFTHASGFSAGSGQYAPPSVAGSSTGPVRTRIGDRQRPAPYPPSSSRSSGSGMVGAGPGRSAPGQGPDVPDRADGVKTPKGVHLRPEIKDRIRELYAGGTISGAEIAGQIPGLTSKQAYSVLQSLRDPSYKTRSSIQRARKMTGNPEATSADYKREMAAQRARKMTGNSEATHGGRPVVALSSRAEAGLRSWNAGDRFSIPGPDGNPQYVEVTRNRQGGEEVYQGDFRLLLRGG
jgi:hypothetical protein